MNIDWTDDQTIVLLNARISSKESDFFQKQLQHVALKSHVWIATSGSAKQKWVALSKQALLTSAHAVNIHLQSHASDVWLNPLPHFHVGGLSIHARAFLSGAKVVPLDHKTQKWNAHFFHQRVLDEKATLVSLVSAQLYDVVMLKLPAPRSLRAVLVGGGALSETLYYQARELSWPILPTYGLTECSSQVATAKLASLNQSDFPSLYLLSHVQARVNDEGILLLNSAALLTLYAEIGESACALYDPKTCGWLVTEDCAEIQADTLRIHGRGGDFVKIGGEGVSLSKLNAVLDEIKLVMRIQHDVALMAIPDQRLEHVIHLVGVKEAEDTLHLMAENFNQHVLPFERIRKIHVVSEIPRTDLNKLRKEELLQLIQLKALF